VTLIEVGEFIAISPAAFCASGSGAARSAARISSARSLA
jgi:hypothetical protein